MCRKFTDDDDSEGEEGRPDRNSAEPTSYYEEQEAIRQRSVYDTLVPWNPRGSVEPQGSASICQGFCGSSVKK